MVMMKISMRLLNAEGVPRWRIHKFFALLKQGASASKLPINVTEKNISQKRSLYLF